MIVRDPAADDLLDRRAYLANAALLAKIIRPARSRA